MRSIFYIFLIFSFSLVYSQESTNGEVTYLDYDLKQTTKQKATYYEFRTPYKENIIKYQKYFIASSAKAYLLEKYFYDKDEKKQAKYQSFRKNGTKIQQGYYKDDLKNGPWELYWLKKGDSVNSNEIYLYKKSIYVDNLRNGPFKELYEDGNIQGEGFYRNNNFNGECKWYHTNNQMSSLENYNDKGKLVDIKQWNEDGVERTKKLKPNHDISFKRQEAQKKIQSILHQKLKPSPDGRVYFHVLVDKLGEFQVMEIESTSQSDDKYKEKAKNIIENIKPIVPFLYHNQLIDVSLKFGFSTKVYQTKKTTKIYKGTTTKRRF